MGSIAKRIRQRLADLKTGVNQLTEYQAPPQRWYPVMNKWSDQTGIAHLLDPDAEVAKPWCGVKVYALGGGFTEPRENGCYPCQRCLARQRKRKLQRERR